MKSQAGGKRVVIRGLRLEKNGVYVLRLAGASQTTGGYILTITGRPPKVKIKRRAEEIALSQTRNSQFAIRNSNSYQFSAAKGTAISIRVDVRKGGEFIPSVRIIDSLGEVAQDIIVRHSLLRRSSLKIRKLPLRATGLHTLIVSGAPRITADQSPITGSLGDFRYGVYSLKVSSKTPPKPGVTELSESSSGPEVVSVQPENGAQDTPLDANIEVVFSRPINPRMVSTGSFILRKLVSAGAYSPPIAGDFTMTNDQSPVAGSLGDFRYGATKVIFDPRDDLDDSSSYTIELTEAIQDADGNSISTKNLPSGEGSHKDGSHISAANMRLTSSFSTLDATGPQVLSAVPSNGTEGVALDSSIILTFSEALDPTTVSSDTIRVVEIVDGGSLLDAGRESVVGEVRLSYGNTRVTFDPLNGFYPSRAYAIVVTDDVKDAAGNAVREFTSTFASATLQNAFIVTSVVPADGENQVDLGTAIALSFSAPANASTVVTTGPRAQRTFRLTELDANGVEAPDDVDGLVAFSNGDAVMTFDPTGNLKGGPTTYKISATAGVKDKSGQSLIPFSSSFTTKDVIPPSVLSTAPADGDANVPVTTDIVISFSEPVDPSTVIRSSGTQDGNVTLRIEGGEKVKSAVTLDASGAVATLKPDLPLAGLIRYELRIESQIKDLAGNSLVPAQGVSVRFATVQDFVPPRVLSIFPESPSAGGFASPDTHILVTMTEPIDPDSVVVGQSFNVTRVDTGMPISGGQVVFVPRTDNAVFRFDPTLEFTRNTELVVTLTPGIRDLAGNPLDQDPVIPGKQSFQNFIIERIQGGNGVADSVAFNGIIDPARGGNSVADTLADPASDDVQMVPQGNPIAPGEVVVGPGPDGILQTAPVGDDVLNDDLQIVPPGAPVGPGAIVVAPGPDGVIRTTPNDDGTGGKTPGGDDLEVGRFITGSTTLGPQVVSIAPLDGAANVDVTANVTVIFSKIVDSATVNANTFNIIGPDGLVSGAVTIGGGGSTATIDPTDNLKGPATYSVSVTTGVADLNGVPLDQNTATPGNQPFTSVFFTEDVTPPRVTSVSPIPGAINVPPTTNGAPTPVVATVSEPVIPATVTATHAATGILGSFRVVDRKGDDVIGSISLSDNNKVITFIPNNPFADSTTFTVMLTDDITDFGGQRLIPFESNFTTSDTTGPRVVAVTPTNGQDSVNRGTTVSVIFSEPIDPDSVEIGRRDTVIAEPPQRGNGVADTLAIGDDVQKVPIGQTVSPNTVVVTSGPNGVLDTIPGSRDLIIAEPAAGGNGTADTLAGGDDVQEVPFGDPVAPGQVVVTAGLNGQLDSVPGGDDAVLQPDDNKLKPGNFTISFNENIEGSTFGVDFVTKGQVTFGVANIQVIFDPDFDLNPLTLHALTITGGIGGITDVAGNPLDQDPMTVASESFQSSFTTAADADNSPPSVVAVSPLNGAKNEVINTDVVITFSEPVDPTTVIPSGQLGASFILRDIGGSGGAISGPGTIDVPGRIVFDGPSMARFIVDPTYQPAPGVVPPGFLRPGTPHVVIATGDPDGPAGPLVGVSDLSTPAQRLDQDPEDGAGRLTDFISIFTTGDTGDDQGPLGPEVVGITFSPAPSLAPIEVIEPVTGGDGVVNTVAANDDVQVIGFLIVEPMIGGDGVASAVALNDDIQVIPVGGPAAPGDVVVTPGADGKLDSAPAGDDAVVASPAAPGETVVTAGPDGVLDSIPAGDDMAPAFGVATNADIIVTFSKEIDPNTVTDTSVRLLVGSALWRGQLPMTDIPVCRSLESSGPGATNDVVRLRINGIIEPLTGGDGAANTVADPNSDDVQIVPLGAAVSPGSVIICPGPDGALQTTPNSDGAGGSVPGGDDELHPPLADLSEHIVLVTTEVRCQRTIIEPLSGGDGLASSTAVNDDVQAIPVGDPAAPGDVVVRPGADGVLQTLPSGDDQEFGNARVIEPFTSAANGRADTIADPNSDDIQIIPPGNPALSGDVVVSAGADGILQSLPNGDGAGGFLAGGDDQEAGNSLIRGASMVFTTTDTFPPDVVDSVAVTVRNRENDFVTVSFNEDVIASDALDITNYRLESPAPLAIFEPAVGGNNVADSNVSGDDVPLALPGATVAPGQLLVAPGPNGTLETVPAVDDVMLPIVIEAPTGGDLVANTTAAFDDVQVVPVGSLVLPGDVIVTPGPNGLIESVPAGGIGGLKPDVSPFLRNLSDDIDGTPDSAISFDPMTNTATITLDNTGTAADNLKTGDSFRIVVSNVRDLTGNPISPSGVSSPVGAVTGDVVSPDILGVVRTLDVSKMVVDVFLSEDLEPAAATDVTNFTASRQIGNPIDATLLADGRTIRLTFDQVILPGDTVLTITNVEDLAGNVININVSETIISAAMAPTITEIVPNSGPMSGGTKVAIKGFNLQKNAVVTFGGILGTVVETKNIDKDEQSFTDIIIVTTPPSPTSSTTDVPVDVTVINPGNNTDTTVNGFTYTGDADSPYVVSTVPRGGAFNWGVNACVVVNFSEAMLASSVDNTATGNFRLFREIASAGMTSRTFVPGVVTFDSSGKRATYTPDDPTAEDLLDLDPTLDPALETTRCGRLAADSDYVIVLDSTLLDLAGNNLDQKDVSVSDLDGTLPGDQQFISSFSTTTVDAAPPRVLSIVARRANGVNPISILPTGAPWIFGNSNFIPAGMVPVSTIVEVTFSEPISPASLTSDAITILPAGRSGPVDTVITLNGEGTRAVIAPISPLPDGTQHTVTVGDAIADMAGNTVAQNVFGSFITAPSAPFIVSLVPSGPTSLDLGTNTQVKVTFSEEIDPSTIDPFITFVVMPEIGQLPGQPQPFEPALGFPKHEVDDQGRSVVTFDPAAEFPFGLNIVVRVTPGITDTIGNHLDQNQNPVDGNQPFVGGFSLFVDEVLGRPSVDFTPGPAYNGTPIARTFVLSASRPINPETVVTFTEELDLTPFLPAGITPLQAALAPNFFPTIMAENPFDADTRTDNDPTFFILRFDDPLNPTRLLTVPAVVEVANTFSDLPVPGSGSSTITLTPTETLDDDETVYIHLIQQPGPGLEGTGVEDFFGNDLTDRFRGALITLPDPITGAPVPVAYDRPPPTTCPCPFPIEFTMTGVGDVISPSQIFLISVTINGRRVSAGFESRVEGFTINELDDTMNGGPFSVLPLTLLLPPYGFSLNLDYLDWDADNDPIGIDPSSLEVTANVPIGGGAFFNGFDAEDGDQRAEPNENWGDRLGIRIPPEWDGDPDDMEANFVIPPELAFPPGPATMTISVADFARNRSAGDLTDPFFLPFAQYTFEVAEPTDFIMPFERRQTWLLASDRDNYTIVRGAESEGTGDINRDLDFIDADSTTTPFPDDLIVSSRYEGLHASAELNPPIVPPATTGVISPGPAAIASLNVNISDADLTAGVTSISITNVTGRTTFRPGSPAQPEFAYIGDDLFSYTDFDGANFAGIPATDDPANNQFAISVPHLVNDEVAQADDVPVDNITGTFSPGLRGEKIIEPAFLGNGAADSTAMGDDVQVVAPGEPVRAGETIITPGNNGILDTPVAALSGGQIPGDDQIRIPVAYIDRKDIFSYVFFDGLAFRGVPPTDNFSRGQFAISRTHGQGVPVTSGIPDFDEDLALLGLMSDETSLNAATVSRANPVDRFPDGSQVVVSPAPDVGVNDIVRNMILRRIAEKVNDYYLIRRLPNGWVARNDDDGDSPVDTNGDGAPDQVDPTRIDEDDYETFADAGIVSFPGNTNIPNVDNDNDGRIDEDPAQGFLQSVNIEFFLGDPDGPVGPSVADPGAPDPAFTTEPFSMIAMGGDDIQNASGTIDTGIGSISLPETDLASPFFSRPDTLVDFRNRSENRLDANNGFGLHIIIEPSFDGDGRANTVAVGDDVQVIPAGTANIPPEAIIIEPGKNGRLDTTPGGDDTISLSDVDENLGVFTTNFIRFFINGIDLNDDEFDFRSVFDPFIPGRGTRRDPSTGQLLLTPLPGVPIGALDPTGSTVVDGDDAVILGQFNFNTGMPPASATPTQQRRFLQINRAIELYSDVVAALIAHEIGHASGLVPEGLNPKGLLGGMFVFVPGTVQTIPTPLTGPGHLDSPEDNLMISTMTFNLATAGPRNPNNDRLIKIRNTSNGRASIFMDYSNFLRSYLQQTQFYDETR